MRSLMSPISYALIIGLALSLTAWPSFAQNTGETIMPKNTRASYGGESVTLANSLVQLHMYKREGGWGWGELCAPDGRLMAILEHLGEVMLRDQDVPMRLESSEYRREDTPAGERLVFPVKSMVIAEKLRGTSFEKWIGYPFKDPVLEGEVTLTLEEDSPVIRFESRLIAKANVYALYVRGPWLKAGQDSFGTAKDDAILPGVEWVIGDEWSSGSDWFKPPWSDRFVPHPNKVTAPIMAVSHDGMAVSLAWDPLMTAAQWFNYRKHRQQPVFATPNFVDKMNSHLLGLMVPDAAVEGQENKPYADMPLEIHIDERIEFTAEIALTPGDSLDAMTAWIQRHGMPTPPEPRWPFKEALDHIATAYNTNFWFEGKGFGTPQHPESIGPHVPGFLERYIRENADTPLGKELRAKVDWCAAQHPAPAAPPPASDIEALKKRGQEVLGWQRPDGAFPFDPDGRHYRKDDFVVARIFAEPMGLSNDTALDMCMLPAMDLMDLAARTGDESFKEGARKALEFCMEMKRPEGGDFWETPLHAPNLFAAGHAAIAYWKGYQAFGDERYRLKAIHWIRTILPFTHLWEPEGMPMLYNTKPCLCSSDWYFANWVRDHVQWEVLAVFNQSTREGIDWAVIDPDVDWLAFQKGVTTAAIRWIVDHKDDNWRPHNMPATYEDYKKGAFDGCYPDTHNSTTGNYGGMFIMPEPIAENIYSVLDAEAKVQE